MMQIHQVLSLIDALVFFFPDTSIRTLKQWLKWQRVLVDGAVVTHPLTMLQPGQQLSICKKKDTSFPFNVIYQDRDILVIDKPIGLLSVPAQEGEDNALQIAAYVLKHQLYSVHRLDKDVSGVLLFAKTTTAQQAFKELFATQNIHREYLAIVEGRVAQDEGVWNAPLKETANYDVVVDPKGEAATTYYHVYRRSRLFSYLHIKLGTGKKHQIRVHCHHAGHPICGDHRYSSTLDPADRICLHAWRLSCVHPRNGKKLCWKAPIPRALVRMGIDQSLPQ